MRELAAHNRISGTLRPVLVSGIFIFAILISIQEGANTTVIIILSVITLGFLSVAYFYSRTLKDISFDDSNLYLKFSGRTEVVPFSNLISLRMTSDSFSLMGFRTYKYLIDYPGVDNRVAEVSFWTGLSNPELDNFVALVAKMNRNFKVKHYS